MSLHFAEKHNPHLSYRPDIDGMRAIAILSVVLFHAFPALLTGGFVGVDVFFVISGYLISSIIMKAVSKGSFSFYDFYMRRVRRIFPALMVVIAATFAAGWAVMMGDEFKLLSKHIMAGIGFLQNVLLYTESGYFDASAETKPLLHLWSLGVEEQFYLVFPIILIALHKAKIPLLPALVSMWLASFILGVAFLADSPSGVFFLPQYRFWEVLTGSILAYLSLRKGGLKASDATGNLMSFTGIIMISLAIALIDKTARFPGYWALLPVVGAALIIAGGPEAWVNRKILSNRVMVFVGLISYPLYLWHWPIFSFAYIDLSGTPSTGIRVALVLTAFILAYLTYLLIETPLRVNVPGPKAFAGLIVIALAFIAVSATTVHKNGFPGRQDERQEFAEYFANGRPEWHYFTENKIPERFRYDCDWYDQTAFFSGAATNVPVLSIAEKCYKSAASKKVLFWGDSHSQMYIYGVTHELPAGIGILSAASSACLPNLPEVDTSPAEYCRRSNQFAIQTIKDQKPDVVIIGQIIGHDVSNSLPQIAGALKSYGVKHVIVMGPVPRWETKLYQIVLRKYWKSTPRFIKDDVVQDVLVSDASLQAKYGEGQGGFEYISMISNICNGDGCMVYIGSDRKIGLTTFDNSHISPAASVYVAQGILVPAIMRNLEGDKR
ncbi:MULTISPECIES: acyltransferase family protein [unclassified Pseudomonas]|uniref:acyltransferase family protein n=1 Tax=unclassified Pseudomonas TaxID=196821 RepID=UPI001314004D|nr:MULTISPECIES: acyltransferase family protein [unclassified Pseudomonas]